MMDNLYEDRYVHLESCDCALKGEAPQVTYDTDAATCPVCLVMVIQKPKDENG